MPGSRAIPPTSFPMRVTWPIAPWTVLGVNGWAPKLLADPQADRAVIQARVVRMERVLARTPPRFRATSLATHRELVDRPIRPRRNHVLDLAAVDAVGKREVEPVVAERGWVVRTADLDINLGDVVSCDAI